MARRILDIAAILAVFLVVGVAAAAGASTPPRQVTDPSATTPAGSVYAIPLESARQDAEPHHRPKATSTSNPGSGAGPTSGTASAAGVAAGASGSGTSGGRAADTATAGGSTAGGGTAGGGRAHRHAAGARSASTVLVPGGQPGSLVASGDGFGSSPEVPGLDAAASGGLAALQSNGSDAPLLAIVLAVVVLGVGGYLGTRGRRRPRGSDPSSA